MMKNLFLLFILLTGMQVYSQTTFDLSTATFKEQEATLLNGLPYHKGLLYDRNDMISYGVDNSHYFSFRDYIPTHVELLTFNGFLAGYAFKIHSYKDQEKIKAALLQQFTGLKLIDSTKWVSIYQYSSEDIVVEFRTIPATDFPDNHSAYLDIKSGSLYRAIAAQEQKYRRP